jgi:hypothetical protein
VALHEPAVVVKSESVLRTRVLTMSSGWDANHESKPLCGAVINGPEEAMRKMFRCGVAWIAFALLPFVDPLAMAQPQDFPMWCHGSSGMASVAGQDLVVNFTPADGPADNQMESGQCSPLDRALNPNEPTRIVYQMRSSATAQTNAGVFNHGGFWTFWVFNDGQVWKATVASAEATTHKPVIIDPQN